MMELAFGDDSTSSELDNSALRNPKFNDIICRAIYKGVCRFLYTNPLFRDYIRACLEYKRRLPHPGGEI